MTRDTLDEFNVDNPSCWVIWTFARFIHWKKNIEWKWKEFLYFPQLILHKLVYSPFTPKIKLHSICMLLCDDVLCLSHVFNCINDVQNLLSNWLKWTFSIYLMWHINKYLTMRQCESNIISNNTNHRNLRETHCLTYVYADSY